MKKQIIITFSLILLGVISYPKLANAAVLSPTAVAIPLRRAEIKVALKKTNAIKEIDRRLASLTNITTRINGITRITDAQKQSLLTQVQNEINNLNDLKTKIQAETDATALQAEKTSIVQSYRVYALFVPEIEIIAQADKIMDIADAMSSKTTDATLLSKIADAKSKAQNAIDLVLPLTPEGYPGNRSVLLSARDTLKTARVNLTGSFALLKANSK